jgi:hypothetical protein
MSEFSSSLTERLMSLKHDLGKYIAWQSANLEETEWRDGSARLTRAVQRDVLGTRTSRDGANQPAWVVYEAGVAGMSAAEREQTSPELGRVEARVRWMQSIEGAITSGDALSDRNVRAEMQGAQREIRACLSALVRRARGG